MRLALPMKTNLHVLLFCALALTSQLARADIIDDTIGNIQQAINDAYHGDSGDSRADDDDEGHYQNNRQQISDRQHQLDDRRRQLDDRQRQLDRDRQQLEEDQQRLDDDD